MGYNIVQWFNGEVAGLESQQAMKGMITTLRIQNYTQYTKNLYMGPVYLPINGLLQYL